MICHLDNKKGKFSDRGFRVEGLAPNLLGQDSDSEAPNALSPLHAFARWVENTNLCKAVISVFSLQKTRLFVLISSNF